jgi:hypothetical protein
MSKPFPLRIERFLYIALKESCLDPDESFLISHNAELMAFPPKILHRFENERLLEKVSLARASTRFSWGKVSTPKQQVLDDSEL